MVSGAPALLGQTAELVEWGGHEGWALMGGVNWRVRAAAATATAGLRPGARVVVRAVHGNTLDIMPATQQPPDAALPPAPSPSLVSSDRR